MVIAEVIKFDFLKIWINHESHQLSYKFVDLSKAQRPEIFIEWIVHELVITGKKECFTSRCRWLLARVEKQSVLYNFERRDFFRLWKLDEGLTTMRG